MDPIIINIKNCDKNMDAIIIKVKKCDKNMEEGSDHDILICEKCPETFNSLKSLESHRKKKHSEKKFICITCGHELFGSKNYNNHIRKHKKFICITCGHELIGSKNYNNHIRKHNAKEKCDKCGKEVVKEYIEKHIVRCKGPNKGRGREKKHSCDKCNKCFDTVKKLETHKKTHDKVKRLTIHECAYCDYWSYKSSHVKIHENSCPIKKRQNNSDTIVTNNDLKQWFSSSHVSVTDFNKIVQNFKEKLGKEFFEKNSSKVISEYCKSMNYLSSTETIEFEDSQGKSITRTLAYISKMEDLIADVTEGRELSTPRLVIGADYGQEKLLVTASIYDDEDPHKKCIGMEPSAPQSSFLLASADLVPETTKNMKIIFNKLGFPLSNMPKLKLVFDLKLFNLIAGIQTASSIMACPFGLCYRINEKGEPSNTGRWVKGEPRTMRQCHKFHEDWMTETGGDRSRLRHYGGCQNTPVSIFDESKADTPFIQLFAPPNLHLLLGKSSI